MGHVCQRQKGEMNGSLYQTQRKDVIKNILGWEGDSSAYKGFCPHSKNRESLYLSFCQSSL